jgi:protein-L-isoaspartate O-methyltransferase
LAGIKTKSDVYTLMASKSEPVSNGYHGYHVETGKPYYETPQALALWALIGKKTPEQEQADQLRRLIQNLQFSNIPGYFVTQPAEIERMIQYARIQPEDNVLEPEAGSGAIADAVRPLCASVTTYEVNYSLAEILSLKGYAGERADFLEVEPKAIFDRVLMNPPFEKMQDIDHVLHAFKFLKPFGRLVSIMGAGVFYNSTKKAVAFRSWLNELGGDIYDVEAGAFKKSGTGVSSKIIVLDTPYGR